MPPEAQAAEATKTCCRFRSSRLRPRHQVDHPLIRRHRLIVLGAFVVMLIILIIILAKACSGGGGGAAQPRPHKTNVHKTTAPGGVGVSPSPIDIVVRSVHVAQGQTVTVGYRINGPTGSKGNVKIAVKDKSDTVKELFTLASAQPTNRDLEYQFVAVLDPDNEHQPGALPPSSLRAPAVSVQWFKLSCNRYA